MESVLTQGAVDLDFIEADEVLDDLHSALRYQSANLSLGKILLRLEKIYERAGEVTRYKILTEMIDMECKEGIPLYLNILEKDKSALVRHEAAFGIGIIGNKSHCDALINSLVKDRSPMVRHEAAIALAEIGGEEHLKILLEATKDKSLEVSSSARFAIQNIQLNQNLKIKY